MLSCIVTCTDYISYIVLPWIPLHSIIVDINNRHPVPLLVHDNKGSLYLSPHSMQCFLSWTSSGSSSIAHYVVLLQTPVPVHLEYVHNLKIGKSEWNPSVMETESCTGVFCRREYCLLCIKGHCHRVTQELWFSKSLTVTVVHHCTLSFKCRGHHMNICSGKCIHLVLFGTKIILALVIQNFIHSRQLLLNFLEY